MLYFLVLQYGRKWETLAKNFNGPTAKQCRERWDLYVNPKLHKKAWTKEEDLVITRLHKIFGNKWVLIAKKLKGRSYNDIKNRYYGHLKRKEE